MNIQITEMKHEKEVIQKDLQQYLASRDSVKEKYSSLKRTHQETQQTKEKYLLEVSQLNNTMRLKDQEFESMRVKLEQMEKMLKDQMAQEMKRIMLKNRENEGLKK